MAFILGAIISYLAVILTDIDAGGDQQTSGQTNTADTFVEPKIGERKGNQGLKVGEDGGLSGFDIFLAFGIGPKSDDGAGNCHIDDAEYGSGIKI